MKIFLEPTRGSNRKRKNAVKTRKIEGHKRHHKHNVLETKEHQEKDDHRNSKFARHKHDFKKAYKRLFGKSTALHHTRIKNHERSEIPEQQVKKEIALSKTERRHLATPCHHNCLGLYLRMKARLLEGKDKRKQIKTLNIKRAKKVTSHSTRLYEGHNHRKHWHIKHKQRSGHKSLKNPFSKKKRKHIKRKNGLPKYASIHSNSEIAKARRKSVKYRPRKVLTNKFRDERLNSYKKKDENSIAAKMKSAVKNSNTSGVPCKDSEKKMKEMIIKMNKAIRRTIILARIIGEKFGIDDKTIETILSKEGENISRNIRDFKKEAVNM